MSVAEQFLAQPTAEQQALADSVERFLKDKYSLEKRRHTIASAAGYDREIWSSFADMGWLAIPFPEEDGGLGGNYEDLAMVMSAFGQAAVLEPYLDIVVLAGSLLAASPPGNLRTELIEATISGEGAATLALLDISRRTGIESTGIEAHSVQDGVQLHGHLVFVPFAAEVDMILVPVRDPSVPDNGLSIYGVRPAEAEINAYPTVDGGRAADVLLDGVYIDNSRLLAGPDTAPALLQSTLRIAMYCVCVEAIAIMDTLIRNTVDYLNTRKQFGQPLANFQALRHVVADMAIDFSLAESTTWMAGHQLNAEDTVLQDRLLAAAKYEVGRAGRRIGQRSIQLHGGIGMTDELIIGHYFKRMVGIDLLYGGWQHWLQEFMKSAN